MPTLVQRLSSGHKCYRCKRIIKKGQSAMRWDYADKKMYAHLNRNCKEAK